MYVLFGFKKQKNKTTKVVPQEHAGGVCERKHLDGGRGVASRAPPATSAQQRVYILFPPVDAHI